MPISAYFRITSSKPIRARSAHENSLPLICGRPLRAGDVVFAPGFGSVCASARFHQTRNERLLLVAATGFRSDVIRNYDSAGDAKLLRAHFFTKLK